MKRVIDVIEIFDRVRKSIPSKLLMIGDGPDRSQAEWLAVQKGIHEHVLFLGKQDQVHEKLAIADVLLMPSELNLSGWRRSKVWHVKSFPSPLASGGVPEVIEHGVSGFLADVGDVETMAGYAIEVLSDEVALRAMGKRARAAAQAKYCSSKIIPLYEDFYRRVLERSPKSS